MRPRRTQPSSPPHPLPAALSPGNLAAVTEPDGRTTRYADDPVGRLPSVTEPDNSTFSTRYDAAGRRTELGYPDGVTVAYRYDRDSALVGLTDSKAGEVSYTLDPDKRVLTETLPGNWSRTYRYDGGLLAHYDEVRNGAPANDTTLTRDAEGGSSSTSTPQSTPDRLEPRQRQAGLRSCCQWPVRLSV